MPRTHEFLTRGRAIRETGSGHKQRPEARFGASIAPRSDVTASNSTLREAGPTSPVFFCPARPYHNADAPDLGERKNLLYRIARNRHRPLFQLLQTGFRMEHP